MATNDLEYQISNAIISIYNSSKKRLLFTQVEQKYLILIISPVTIINNVRG